jgi:hypothetical protein
MKEMELIGRRFKELDIAQTKLDKYQVKDVGDFVDPVQWQAWATAVLNLLQRAFSEISPHYVNFKRLYDTDGNQCWWAVVEHTRGVFQAAKEDYEGGYVFNLYDRVSGELFGDFIALAKNALQEGHKDVAAVLACAALEDALKKYAQRNDLDVGDQVMQAVVSALKSKGLVAGAQKSLLDTMPKIRDYAMHANWDKIKPEDVSSVIGFVEQFLLSNF